MESLLGQFYSRIGVPEDIASEGIAYILGKSEYARKAINNMIFNSTGLALPDLVYSTQNVGDKLERPDISGRVDNIHERLIIEAKFEAALTEKQPIEYLNRLKSDSVLMFVCPSWRTHSLMSEIARKIKTAYDKEVGETLNITFESGKHLIIKTWSDITNSIKSALEQENRRELVSDIDQIIGLCNKIDTEAFRPLTSDDLAISIPRRIISYTNLIDKIIEKLNQKEVLERGKYNATGQIWGYSRYARTEKWLVALELNFEYWAKTEETPLWLDINNVNEVVSDDVLIRAKTIGKHHIRKEKGKALRSPYFPLYPQLGLGEEEIVNQLTENITEILRKMDSPL